jgi:hypothetical protein
MRGFPWLKLWIEDMDDDRFEVAADVARSTRAAVWSAYSRLLRLANKNEDRGSIAGLHPLAIASWCQVPLDEIQRIIEAFTELGIIAGDRLADWEARQQCEKVEKPRSANAKRVARHRERKKAEAAQPTGITPGITGITPGITSGAEEEESENNRVSAISLESVTARAREGCFESDPDVPAGAARPLAPAVASEDQPPPPRQPDAYAAGTRVAKRDNMLATLRGAIRLLRWSEADRDFIEALQKITGDDLAWANRSKADKQTLNQLKAAADEYSAQHGAIQALGPLAWVPTEDPYEAREALRDVAHIFERQNLENWEQRRSRAARPGAAAPVLEPSCAA